MPESYAPALAPLSRELPFPGLRPYDEADANWFFGRSAEINDLLKRLRRLHFIAIVGASGSGKSSLVRAGVLPHIRDGFLDAEWQIATFRPGERPVANLAEALGSGIISDPEDPHNLLHSGPQGLVRAIQSTRPAEDSKILILVDQFEELFQYAQRTGESGQEQIKEFLKLLLAAAASDDVNVYVILTMRLEWLNECATCAGLAEAINAGIYLVPQMQRRQFGQAITGPLNAASGSLTSALFDRMLNDLDNKTDQLPVLQHALLRLWERGDSAEPLDIAGYEEVGTFSSCLSAHAEEVYGELFDREKHVAQMLFRTITQVSKNRKIRRALPVSEIMSSTRLSLNELAPVILAFGRSGRSFLVTTPGALTPASIVDISHEALIRQWTRLGKWVDEEAETQTRMRRLDEDAAEWNTDRRKMKACLYTGAKLQRARELLPLLDANGVATNFLKGSERADFWMRGRRRAAIVVALGVLAGIALATVVVSRESAARAQVQAQLAAAQASVVSLQARNAQSRLDELVDKIQHSDGSAKELAAIAKAASAPQVYLHYAAGAEDSAKKLQAMLKQRGYAVPALDQADRGAEPQQTEVVYYHREDRAEAGRLAALLPGGAVAQLLPNPNEVFPQGQFGVLVASAKTVPAETTLGPATIAKSEPPIETSTAKSSTAPVMPAPTLTASISPTNVQQGKTVTLDWDAENASEVQLSGYGRIPLKGPMVLPPAQKSETYTLTAKGDGGTTEKSLTVVVTSAAAVASTPAASPAAAANPDISAIKRALARYKDAYESESVADMRAAWPSMSKFEEKNMKTVFDQFNAIRLTLACPDAFVDITGSTATATCQQSATYTLKGKVQPKQTDNANFKLRKIGTEWVVVDVQ